MITDTEWNQSYRAQANAEGWDIFDSRGSGNGDWQIQKCDDPEEWPTCPNPSPFESDDDVWLLVKSRAAEGSELHTAALGFIKDHNPEEYDSIMKFEPSSDRFPTEIVQPLGAWNPDDDRSEPRTESEHE